MRCRKIEKNNGVYELVFFNSKGKSADGTAIKVAENHGGSAPSSYADGIEGVNQSLIQRLSLIQGELPHFMNAGFPLFNKIAEKSAMDAYLIDVLTHYRDIINIEQINSEVENHVYSANIKIRTIYGDLNFVEKENI